MPPSQDNEQRTPTSRNFSYASMERKARARCRSNSASPGFSAQATSHACGTTSNVTVTRQQLPHPAHLNEIRHFTTSLKHGSNCVQHMDVGGFGALQQEELHFPGTTFEQHDGVRTSTSRASPMAVSRSLNRSRTMALRACAMLRLEVARVE